MSARLWNELRRIAWLVGALVSLSLFSIGVAAASVLLLDSFR